MNEDKIDLSGTFEQIKCLYCNGDCPKDEDHACDGYLGDIDNLYDQEEKPKT